MNKQGVGRWCGIGSLFCVVLYVISFFVMRGPDVDIYLSISLGGVLSLLGIVLAIVSTVLLKRFVYLVIGLLGNGAVLACSFLLLLAMGISEP
ncbi:hypothetical protein ACTHQ4_13490 [Alkalicoccobacillus gibsonii]|uniref:hypothetical protein n=1 Tax=Alkalicoccobacillus gibsonii TaxID=79881 RepID=UPI003F7BEFE8